jgi:hypothetical protein
MVVLNQDILFQLCTSMMPSPKTHHDEAFTNLQPSREFFMRLYEHADMLRGEIEKFINQFDIDILVPQNALTIPMNIALGIAIGDVIRRHRIKTIAHHHDFYWERERFIPNDIQDVLNEAFPANATANCACRHQQSHEASFACF